MDPTCTEGAGLSQEAVEEAVRALLRAVQTLRTYPSGNEMSQRALLQLASRLRPVLPLELDVRAEGLRWSGEPLREGAAERASAVTQLYRDGVRQIELRLGLEAEETSRLVLALARPVDKEDPSEDTVTRLWEAGLPHVQIAAVDPYFETDFADDVLEGKERPEFDPEDLPRRIEAPVPPPPEEAFRVTHEDARRVAADIERDATTPPWQGFIAALIATLDSPIGLRRHDEMLAICVACFERLVEGRHFDLASALLEELGRTGADEAAALRARTYAAIAHPELLAKLHQAIESGDCPGRKAEALLLRMPPPIAGALCALLARAGTDESRRFYIDLLVRLGEEAVAPVIEAFQAGDSALRAQLAPLLGRLRDAEAITPLCDALTSDDRKLRREVVRALTMIKHPAALGQLIDTAVSDADASCRVIALRGIGSDRNSVAEQRLLERTRSREFSALSDEEKDLVFAALGRMGGEASMDRLGEILQPGWLSRGRHRDNWRRAALALARLATPEAIQLLSRLSGNRRKELAEVCAGALHEILKERR